MIKRLTANAKQPKGFWGTLMIHKMNRGHAAMTNWALAQWKIEPSDIVLDIGCGGGKTVSRLHLLATQGKVYGADYSELSVQKALKCNKAEVKKGQVEIVCADVGKLPFEDSMFDKITAVETIYFWPDLSAAFQEIRRVLKPNAKWMIVCDMWQSEDGQAQKYQDVCEFLQMRLPKISELEQLLQAAGFEHIKSCVHPEQKWLCVLAENSK